MTISDDRVKCAICGHTGPGRVPKGGDGSALHPYPHKERDRGVFARPCWGSHQEGLPVSPTTSGGDKPLQTSGEE